MYIVKNYFFERSAQIKKNEELNYIEKTVEYENVTVYLDSFSILLTSINVSQLYAHLKLDN